MKGKLSREFEFDLAAGITLVDTKPAIPPDYYFSAAFRYQITPHLQLLLSGSHDLIFTTGTDLTEQNRFKSEPSWALRVRLPFPFLLSSISETSRPPP